MRLVQSSIPGAVERDQAIHLLTDRAVLTRMVCRELLDAIGDDPRRLPGRRSLTALYMLTQWIGQNLPDCVQGTPYPVNGIDQMVVPEGYQKLFEEIRSGTQVAQALALYFVCDSDADRARIPDLLTSYWKQHAAPIGVTWTAI
jgi:hypothetical protein